ncbi:MAG TPA: oligosaccharide flippase family protein [Verrucomicrobiae bacterium]|jgi:O-antigen/teichoic acid export membrane protein
MPPKDLTSHSIPAADDPSLAEHGKERNRKLKRNVLVSVLLRSTSALVPLIVMPFLFRYLKIELYGVYETFTSFVLILGLGNAGLSYGLMNFLTVCFAERDHKKARELISTFLTASIVLLGTLAILGLVVAFVLPWQRVLKLSDGAASAHISLAAAIAILFTLLTIFCGIMDAVYGAYQNFAAVSAWDAASKFAATIAVVAVTYSTMGLVGAVCAGIGVPALIKLAGVIDLFNFRLPEIRPQRSLYRREYLRALVVDGSLLFVLALSFSAIFQIDKMIIAVISGPAQVARFSILSRIYFLVFGLYSLSFRSLWPAFGEAIHRQDFAWIKRSMWLTIVAGTVIISVASGALLCFSDPLYRLLLGKTNTAGMAPTPGIVLSFMVCFLVNAWTSCFSTVLNAARVLRLQCVIAGSHALLTVLLMPVMIRHWGISGAAWAPVIASLPTSAWGYPWLVRKYIFKAGRNS